LKRSDRAEAVARTLAEITKQGFGTDFGKWSKWFRERAK
jgi:hypothetical protein